MRISDWSSDVCSSDLRTPRLGSSSTAAADSASGVSRASATVFWLVWGQMDTGHSCRRWPAFAHWPVQQEHSVSVSVSGSRSRLLTARAECSAELFAACSTASPLRATRRSEEHTSELQSLMRISYAVFCLKKK